MNIFYVYEHWRPDTNTCFYVGKGKEKRAWNMKRRNKHHAAIQSKLTAMGMSVDVRVVIKDLSEEAAFYVERDRITLYPREFLANQTDGGEGSSNPSPEIRNKISRAHKGKVISAEARAVISIATKAAMTTEVRNKISAMATKRRASPETRAKMSLSKMGKARTPEICARISEGQRGRVLSAVTRAKISATKRRAKKVMEA